MYSVYYLQCFEF
nr:unnamed protein product [Callosobruchus chinensis]